MYELINDTIINIKEESMTLQQQEININISL